MTPDILANNVMRLPGVEQTTVQLNPDMRSVSSGDFLNIDLPQTGELMLREMYLMGDLTVKTTDGSTASGAVSNGALRIPEDSMSLVNSIRVEAGGEVIDGQQTHHASFLQRVRKQMHQHKDDKQEDFVSTNDGFNPDTLNSNNHEQKRLYFKDFPGLLSYSETVPEVIDLSLLPKMSIQMQFEQAKDVILPIIETTGEYSSVVDGLPYTYQLDNLRFVATFLNTKETPIGSITRQNLSAGAPVEYLFSRYITRELGKGGHVNGGISRFDITSESLDWLGATFRPVGNLRKNIHYEKFSKPFTGGYSYDKHISGFNRLTSAPVAQSENDDATQIKTHAEDRGAGDNEYIRGFYYRFNGANLPLFTMSAPEAWQITKTDKETRHDVLSMGDYLRNHWLGLQRFTPPNMSKRVQSGLNCKGLRAGIEFITEANSQAHESEYSLFMVAKCSSTLVVNPNQQVYVRI